jgi:hypothetical protein
MSLVRRDLTAQELAQWENVRDSYLNRCWATGPCDRTEAEQALKQLYRAAKIPTPPRILWAESPSAAIKLDYRQHNKRLGRQAAHCQYRLNNVLVRQPNDRISAKYRNLEIAVNLNPLWADPGWAEPPLIGNHQLENALHRTGQRFDAGAGVGVLRLAIHTFLRDHLGANYGPNLNPHLDALSNMVNLGPYWPSRGHAIMTERPTVLHRDALNQLHCETGPARVYQDGLTEYVWHGTAVPSSLITDDWDAQAILNERNAEIRRCAIEKMGWDQFAIQADLKQVGPEQPDPANPGFTLKLYQLPLRIARPLRHLLVCTNASLERDGTRRQFGLAVDGSITEPIAAAAWLLDLTKEQYLTLNRAS